MVGDKYLGMLETVGEVFSEAKCQPLYRTLLPQCVLGHASLQGVAGGKDAHKAIHAQESCPGESQSCSGATARYEAERGYQKKWKMALRKR